MTCGYVYVILLRECISQQLHIFKIGRTTDVFSRYKAYPKGSKILFVHYVDNHIEAENNIIEALKSNPHIEQKLDFGTEYFEGPFSELSRIVCKYSMSGRENNAETDYLFRYDHLSRAPSEQHPNEIRENQSSRKTSLQHNIQDFLDEKKDLYQEKVVKFDVLYDALCGWLQEGNMPRVSQTQLRQYIKHTFDTVDTPHDFPDGVHQAYNFIPVDLTTYENASRFAKENFRKNEHGFFTLQQAKKAYMEKDYCSFRFQEFKEYLEAYLDTICIDKKNIGGKIWNDVYLGYEIHPVSMNPQDQFLDICVEQTGNMSDFFTLGDLNALYRTTTWYRDNKRHDLFFEHVKKILTKKYGNNIKIQFERLIKNKRYRRVFSGVKLNVSAVHAKSNEIQDVTHKTI